MFRRRWLWLLLISFPCGLVAQPGTIGTVPQIPTGYSAAVPAACTDPSLYSAGGTLYICHPANTWTAVGTGGGGGNVSTTQTNVYGAFLQDFSAATIKLPQAAGFTSTVNSTVGLDTTANLWHFFTQGADSINAVVTSTDTTTTHPLFATGTAGVYGSRAIAVGDLPASTVFTNQSNVFGAFLQDFSASTMKVPQGAGCTASASATICLDTTAKIFHFLTNSADSLNVATTATDTNTAHGLFASAVAGIYTPRAIGTGDLPAGLGSTTTAHNVEAPLVCADSSASGSAQVCNTSPTFTPAAGDCVIYTTTTANTGAGLTLNVNSLGAKSVAKWQASTTLTANDILANKEVLTCYDGTNWELHSIGNAPGGAVSSVNTLTGAVVIEAATAGQVAISGGNAAALTGAADMTYTTHTFATTAAGIFDWSAATGTAAFKVPSTTTNTATAAAVIDFDTTAGLYHGFFNGGDHTFLYTSGPLGTPASATLTNATGLPESSLTGSTGQTTITETAIAHEITRAGVETTTLTYPYIFQNTNATNTATGALGIYTVGAGNAQIPLIVAQNVTAGDLAQMGAGTFTNGVLSAFTPVFKVGNAGLLTLGAATGCTVGSGGGACANEGTAFTGATSVDGWYADSTQHAIEVNSNNTGPMPVSRTGCVNVTPVTVAANVTSDQLLMACSFNANLLNVVGRTLKVYTAGVFSTAAASTASLTFKVKLCTVSGCGSGTVISPTTFTTGATTALTAANLSWSNTSYISTQTAGATSAYEAHGFMTIDLSATAATPDSTYQDANTATVGTIDSTGALFLQITCAASAASTSNSFTERQLVVEVVN